jgi:hypothetical protein
MERVIRRRAHYLSEIDTAAQLREARRELEIREWFARERLAEDAADTFTVDNLLSIVAPPGSLVDRVIGGVGTGIAAAQGLWGFFGSMLRGRSYGRGYAQAARVAHTTPAHTVRKRQPARRPAGHPAHAAHPAHPVRPAPRKRTPEIEVEVELDE